MNIFQLDWVLIDSIIIILLVFLLVSVRLYKEKSRWRKKISNISLETHHLPLNSLNIQGNNINIKRMTLFRNSDPSRKAQQPLLIINEIYIKKELRKILIQGLASYGFTILTINNKAKFYRDLSWLLEYINHHYPENYSSYMIIGFKSSKFSYEDLLGVSKCHGIILINPAPGKALLNVMRKGTTISNNLCFIYSFYSHLLVQNQNLRKIRKMLSEKLLTEIKFIIIEKARQCFKHYETILLTYIIRYIEERNTHS
jgi:hypothetical protein